MLDNFLFVGLPYIAIFVCIVGVIYRLRFKPYSVSSLSSQFLESNELFWGSVPWHIGIIIILAGHLVALFFPQLWHKLLLNSILLYVVESLGVMLAILAVFGLAVLSIRRITSARIQSVTTVMDLFILLLLIGQIVLGLAVAVNYRWGALWSTATAVPYVWSLLTFKPDASYVADLPVLVRGHIVGAWLIILALPFSRLVHVFSLPLSYLWRSPQKVVWANVRRAESVADGRQTAEARRYFLRALAGVAAGGALFSVGAADKLFRFFFGPRLSGKQEADLMSQRVKRLEKTIEQKKYELEREENDYIFVARLSDLSETKGHYFIDYHMRPALAFKDKNGLPLLISAKCTHLGCTVGSDVDSQGKLLCPCHISYFDVQTGQPNPDSPAKAPLAHLGWVLMNREGKMVASKAANDQMNGNLGSNGLDGYSVFIAKYFKEEA